MSDKAIKLNTTIVSSASVVGKTEKEGPLGDCFDMYDETDSFDSDTWEKSESEMQRRAFIIALKKSKLGMDRIGSLFAGDLLNQCVGSAYGLLDYDIPYFGLYGACSTAAESIILASVMTSTGLSEYSAAVTSSHFCSSERQFRTPLEYGSQRTPTAQRTVTGSGAFIVGKGGKAKITEAMPGIVVDKGIDDASNMGAAMAPAALSTLMRYFKYCEDGVDSFDLIVTGDLGNEGVNILADLARAEGLEIKSRLNDCGLMIYDREKQDAHAGGSGCGCSAVVLASSILPKIESGELKRVLFIGTGAMMSPSSIQQGLSIPAVAHLIRIENTDTGI